MAPTKLADRILAGPDCKPENRILKAGTEEADNAPLVEWPQLEAINRDDG